jgi:hypothetical protein
MALSQILKAIRQEKEDLYVAAFSDDVEVPFRLLPLKKAQQYTIVLSLTEEHALKNIVLEDIFRFVVLDEYLKSNQDIPSGIPESVANLVLHLSGMTDLAIEVVDGLLTEERQKKLTIVNFMQRVICKGMPGYTLEATDDLTFPQLTRAFVAAEQNLIESGIIEQEFDITSNSKEKPPPSNKKLMEQIKADSRALSDFDKPRGPNPLIEKLRQDAALRAQMEEEAYQKTLKGKK